MKLVIDGNAAAGTIEMGGFDYHTRRPCRPARRAISISASASAPCLEYAARVGKPVMIYVFSDGSLASNGMIDSSVAGRGKGVWTADNQNVAATYFLVYNPAGKAGAGAEQSGAELADRLLQSRRLAEYDQQSRGQQRAEPGADGGAQLHGAAQRERGYRNSPTLYPAPNLNNTLGSGHRARTPDRVPAARGPRERKSPA